MPLANAIGDDFLNKCYSNTVFFASIQRIYTSVFGWTEPYTLFLLIFILLIILPVLFKFCSQGSFLKIHRLYNIIRLGLMSLFHQVAYSYTFSTPFSIFVGQPSPCTQTGSLVAHISDFQYPFSPAISAGVFFFSVMYFSRVNRFKSFLSLLGIFTILVLSVVGTGYCSLFQVVSTIFISYILHFIHLHIKFTWIHIENLIVFAFNICATLYSSFHWHSSLRILIYMFMFPYCILLIDEFMIIRHHFTRGGFSTVERPVDIAWTIEMQHTESIRLLNTAEEDNFEKHLDTDILSSVFSFFFLFFAILIRNLVTSMNFFVAPA